MERPTTKRRTAKAHYEARGGQTTAKAQVGSPSKDGGDGKQDESPPTTWSTRATRGPLRTSAKANRCFPTYDEKHDGYETATRDGGDGKKMNPHLGRGARGWGGGRGGSGGGQAREKEENQRKGEI